MTRLSEAEELSQLFAAFPKSEQWRVYDAAHKDMSLVVNALILHLEGIASGSIFENYQIDRLGEWIGRSFTNHTLALDTVATTAIASADPTISARNRAEVYGSFYKGLMLGRERATVEISEGLVPGYKAPTYDFVSPEVRS